MTGSSGRMEKDAKALVLLPEESILKTSPASCCLQISSLSAAPCKITVGSTGGACGLKQLMWQLFHITRKKFSKAHKPFLDELIHLKNVLY